MLLHYKINTYSVQSEFRQPEVIAIVTTPVPNGLAVGCNGKARFGVSSIGCTGTKLGYIKVSVGLDTIAS